MRIFDKDWLFIDEELSSELLSLEREGVIYTDRWQEHLCDFRHVRIRFTAKEIEEYVRGLWAYEIFLRAGSPDFAADVLEIPGDIAKRADEYVLQTRDGETIGPPHHCPAAFMTAELEDLVCYSSERVEILTEVGAEALLSTVKRAIDSLTPSIRLFNSREKGLQRWPIDCEDDIRDLLYALLRAAISDIQREEPVPSKGGTYKKVDLYSKIGRLFIEVKWVYKKGSWKQVLKQINDDIQSYVTHPDCETLIFVVIDAAKDIPDPSLFESDLTAIQSIHDKTINIQAFVREP